MAIEELPHIEKVPSSEADWFAALIGMARYLRSPQGCPWDREQSAAQFARFSHGEGAELVEAFEKGDSAHIAEEFGDTLFTLLASAAAAEEEGLFRLEEALRLAHEKMVRRHDHVFGAEKAATAEEAIVLWERAKAAEKARKAAQEDA